MALITATRVNSTATTVTAAAAATTMTINRADLPAILAVINGAGAPINVTLEDPGTTALGNAPTEAAQAVANGVTRHFKILPAHADADGVATVTLSSATSITYTLIK